MKTVSLREAVRYVGNHVRAQPSERFADDLGRSDAIDVEVAEYPNGFLLQQRTVDPAHRLVHVAEIEYIVLRGESGINKELHVGGSNATIIEQLCYQSRVVDCVNVVAGS